MQKISLDILLYTFVYISLDLLFSVMEFALTVRDEVICSTGPPGTVYYFPAAPSGSVRVPFPPVFVPHPLSSGMPMPPLPVVALRANLVKQIEYYFR